MLEAIFVLRKKKHKGIFKDYHAVCISMEKICCANAACNRKRKRLNVRLAFKNMQYAK